MQLSIDGLRPVEAASSRAYVIPLLLPLGFFFTTLSGVLVVATADGVLHLIMRPLPHLETLVSEIGPVT